jgi:hypothetical protein
VPAKKEETPMPLLDFSNPLVADASVGMSPEPGSGQLPDPTTMMSNVFMPSPPVSGTVTGVVNALGQSVTAFFNQLPQDFGLAVPSGTPVGPLAGGMGMGTLLLIGLGVYLLTKKGR